MIIDDDVWFLMKETIKVKILERNGFYYDNINKWWFSNKSIISFDMVYDSSIEKLVEVIRTLKRKEPKL